MSLADNFRQSTPLIWLAIPRIVVGYHFLEVGWPKIAHGFYNGAELPEQLLSGVAKDPFLWHQNFINGVVLPHPVLFSHLVAFGEVAIGLSLVLGCLVRLSSVFGLIHNFNILLAVAIPGRNGAQTAINGLFIALHFVFVLASAGRVLGLDGILKKGFPQSRLF